MKKIILIIFFLFFIINCYAITQDEAQNYVGKFCYIKQYKHNYSDIEQYQREIGKVLDLIYDEEWKFIVIDYKAELKLIKIDRVTYIKIIGD